MNPENVSVSYILPIKDIYSCQNYGAVSLVVSEFINHSNHDQHFVFGKKHKLKVLKYGKFIPRKVLTIPFVKKSLLFSVSCLFYIKTKLYKNNIIEIHNRPKMFRYFNFFNNYVIVFFHNHPRHMEGSKTVNERMHLINHASKLFFNSNFIKNQFLEGLNLSDQLVNKCAVVYPSFDFKKYNFLKQTGKKKTIIFVGRLVPDKGCLEFLTAFNAVKKECPDWQLIIVGPMTNKNNDYVKKVHVIMGLLEKHLIYYNYQNHEDVLKLFASSEIACLPSQWEEPFGRVVMEAMAMGCATITSKRGGIPEITGQEAIIIEPTVENLKKELLRLTQDDVLRQSFQVKGRQRIQEKFDLEKTSKRIDDLRAQVIKNNN